MNMKKLMAVVLAVVLAISAMAVTAFAGEAEVKRIDIYSDRANTNYWTSTWEFNFPIYNLYGYANQDSYLELRLPNTLGASWIGSATIKWSIVVNGQSFGLKETSGNSGYSTQYVNFGALTHSYFNNNGEDVWATIPQTVNFNEINTLKLVAECKLPGDATWNNIDDDLKYNMWAQLWTKGANGQKDYNNANSDDEKVTGSTTYRANMDVTKGSWTNTKYYNEFKFISDENNVVYLDNSPVVFPAYEVEENGQKVQKPAIKTDDAGNVVYTDKIGKTVDGFEYKIPEIDTTKTPKTDAFGNTVYITYTQHTIVSLTWDHTLENRSYVLGAESAKLVVELKDPMYGVGYYSLYVADSYVDSEINQNNTNLWWQGGNYNRQQKWVQTVFVNGNASTLEFDVPVSALVNGTYGIGSVAAAMNGEFRIYRQFETDKTGFQDQGWRYAYNNNDINYRYVAKAIYLELTMPADEGSDNVDVDAPVESNTPDEETEEPGDVNVNEQPEEPEDTNPPTGIVLAVLPMVIAAAAVVASKRR